jgi:hypothetical protein
MQSTSLLNCISNQQPIFSKKQSIITPITKIKKRSINGNFIPNVRHDFFIMLHRYAPLCYESSLDIQDVGESATR